MRFGLLRTGIILSKLKKRAAVLCLGIGYPGAVGFGALRLNEVGAIAATVEIAPAIWAQAVSLEDIHRKARSTIVTLPHNG